MIQKCVGCEHGVEEMFRRDRKACVGCEHGIEEMFRRDRKAMSKHGWISHIVLDDPDYPQGMNYHTHGLMESFKHEDIQVCLAINPNLIHSVVSGLVNLIKEGRTFSAGQTASGDIQNLDVTFAAAKEGDRNDLRLIFPDSTGALEESKMADEHFKAQWVGTIPKVETIQPKPLRRIDWK